MSTTVQRTPGSKAPERQYLFFRDLASPISAHRASRFATPGQAAAVSALWRENFSTSDNPPPPPVFTLEDRIDFSPEPALHELPTSPESAPDPKTPTPARNYFATPSPIRTRAAEGSSGNRAVERSPASGSWWAPQRSEEKGKGSPVDGMVNLGALITLPPPREVARPEMKRSQLVPPRDGMLDEVEWVTVYGFPPGDTNLVLCEFEKCGVILKHIPGPRDANWMHILYEEKSREKLNWIDGARMVVQRLGEGRGGKYLVGHLLAAGAKSRAAGDARQGEGGNLDRWLSSCGGIDQEGSCECWTSLCLPLVEHRAQWEASSHAEGMNSLVACCWWGYLLSVAVNGVGKGIGAAAVQGRWVCLFVGREEGGDLGMKDLVGIL